MATEECVYVRGYVVVVNKFLLGALQAVVFFATLQAVADFFLRSFTTRFAARPFERALAMAARATSWRAKSALNHSMGLGQNVYGTGNDDDRFRRKTFKFHISPAQVQAHWTVWHRFPCAFGHKIWIWIDYLDTPLGR